MTNSQKISVDTTYNGFIKWGGLSLLGAGILLVLFILSVFISQQTLPLPAQEVLEDPTGPTALFVLAAIGEFLLLPGFVALYFAFKNINKTAMLMATVFMSAAVPLFLASRGLIMSLSQMSGKYMNTSDQTMKVAYLASAEHAIETQNMYAMMALILLSLASILVGIVMFKGDFGSKIGIVAILAGCLSLFSPLGVMVGIPIVVPFIGLVLMAVWQVFVGAKLFIMSKAL